jgi:predicted transposase/invertase (TIGR01784 family)
VILFLVRFCLKGKILLNFYTKNMTKKLIRFDWAMKKLLRHKANFGILEGFLSELLRFDVTIESVLESEGNQEDEYDKYNRVDILVKSQNNELLLIEVQNDSEVDWAAIRYFHRMLYGVSKLVTEYIKEGELYGTIKKIYSINIVYFGLGQGKDYVYEYKGEFIGLSKNDILLPTTLQKQGFKIEKVADIFPKYFILKVNNFNDIAKNTFDEWIYFLKNSEVKDTFKAKGLDKAKEKLRYENLSDEDKRMYNRSIENRRIEMSVQYTRELEAKQRELEIKQEAEQRALEAKQEGKQERNIEIAKGLFQTILSNEEIAKYTSLTVELIEQLRKETV